MNLAFHQLADAVFRRLKYATEDEKREHMRSCWNVVEDEAGRWTVADLLTKEPGK